MKRSLSLLLALAITSAASAAMRLDGDHVSVKPKPEDETISVTFTFKNDGKKPVRILHLDSACSCLSASLDTAVYEPGQKGTGTANFKVGSFTGEQEKVITVTTDDPEQPEWVVPFVISVPEVVIIEPKNVQWWLNEKPTAKEMTVKMTGDPMKLTNVTSTRESMEVSFKEVKAGREYTITLTPKGTDEIMIGALKLETDSKIPKYQRQLGFFSIVRQPESRKGEATAGAKVPDPANDIRDGKKPEEVKKPEATKPEEKPAEKPKGGEKKSK